MVAGHSPYTWRTNYDTQCVEATQVLVSALQEKRDTVGPLLNLNLPKRSLDDDMKKRLDELRMTKKKSTQRRRGVLSGCTQDKLFTRIKVLDRSVLEVGSTLSLKKWASRLMKSICHPSSDGIAIRDILKSGLFKERQDVISFTTSKAFKKFKSGKEIEDIDIDVLYQVVLRMYLSAKKKK